MLAFWDVLDDLQRCLGSVVALRELLYLLGSCVAAVLQPAYLMISLRATLKAYQRRNVGLMHALVYIAAPEKVVAVALFGRTAFVTQSILAVVALDSAAVVALLNGFLKGGVPLPLALGYVITAVGGIAAIGMLWELKGLKSKLIQDYSVQDAKEEGYSASELAEAGVEFVALKQAGFDAKELAQSGFGVNDLACFSDQSASGLTWNEVGTGLPQSSNELTNQKLSKALESKTKFTEDEWEQFGINGLQMNDSIRASGKYFQPAENKNGFTISEIAEVGFGPKELHEGGFSMPKIKELGHHSPKDLLSLGFTLSEIKEARFEPK